MKRTREVALGWRKRLLVGFLVGLLIVLLAALEMWAAPRAHGAVEGSIEAPRRSGGETASGTEPDAIWDGLLHRYVHHGGVDYRGLSKQEGELSRYLNDLAVAHLASLDRQARLAFWINAYNASVVDFVIARYPGLRSVRDVDGFFDGLKIKIADKERTLDEIEAKARSFGDPRVHFALVCASASCPDLRAEAYRGSRLDIQLDSQVKTFLANSRKGLRFDRASNTLYLSSIFKWYAGDFTGGSTIIAYFVRGGVEDWVVRHLPSAEAAEIRTADPSVSYMDYDWSLNDRPR